MSSQYAIVTPYLYENRSILERCIASVKRQTTSTDHIVVADGFPQDWVDAADVRHIRLDHAHRDWGDTPRGLGAMMAVAKGYSGIGFLDADCWLEPDHVQYCIELAEQAGPGGCDYIAALRHLRRPDGSILDVGDEPIDWHIDTNCFFVLRSGFHMLPVWLKIPREASAVCDRVFYLALRSNGLRPTVATRKTVNYVSNWAFMYYLAGEAPPPGAKGLDHQGIISWIAALSERERSEVNSGIRADIADVYGARTRSERQNALIHYLERAQRDIHPHELFYSLYQAAMLQFSLGFSPDEILATCLRASDALPSRAAEVLHPAARYCRLLGRYEEGYRYAKRAAAMPMQNVRENWIYDYGLLEELARNSFCIGRYEECLEASDRLLRGGKAPEDLRGSVRKMADYAAGIITGFYFVKDAQRFQRHDSDRYREDSEVLERLLRLEDDPFLRARYTFYLALAYQNRGDGEKALATSEEAVRLHRELVDRDLNAFLPELASALNNLSNRLSDSGRIEEALAAGEEAVRLHREHVARNADANLAELASALNDLSNRLSDSGRIEEALAASEEAVRLYRALAGRDPGAFLPELASALNNLSNRLSDSGRIEEALAASEEAGSGSR